MKTVRLIAFRNADPLNPAFVHESSLIRAGHAGIQLEGDATIYGFHPTQEAIAGIGGEEVVLDWLVERHTLEGAVFDDTAIFVRAHELARLAFALTTVYVLQHQLSDDEFATIQAQLVAWHRTGATFPYAWPQRSNQPMPPDRDNCATFPRRLHIPIPEETGRLFYYVAIMERDGRLWDPED